MMSKSMPLVIVVCLQLLLMRSQGCHGQTDVNSYCESADHQLLCYKNTEDHTKENDVLTTIQGQPIGDILNSRTAGSQGPVVMEDALLLKELAQFNRERIPERIAHATGAGAHGQLNINTDFLEKYSKAAVFRKGSSSPAFVRFSQARGESGSQDTITDVRGFAVKVKTAEGIWDLVGNNMPSFLFRDARLFTSHKHAQNRNPRTHLLDPNMNWDFLSLSNASTLFILYLYSDLRTPASYREMNGFGVHTFKLVNSVGEHFFVRFNWKTDQGIRNFTMKQAYDMTAQNPDYYLQDLYENIAKKNFPSWTLTVQILTEEQADSLHFDPIDVAKVWFTDEIPEHAVGTLILNKNSDNYFAEVEQSAFDPSNMPPGIEPSADKLLHARMFAYLDTQYYRLGVNFNHLPVNRPTNKVIANTYRDGYMTCKNSGGMPNYNPNSFLKASAKPQYKESASRLHSPTVVDRYEQNPNDNLSQAKKLYKSFSETDKIHLAQNLAADLQATFPFIRERELRNFKAVSIDLEHRIRSMLKG